MWTATTQWGPVSHLRCVWKNYTSRPTVKSGCHFLRGYLARVMYSKPSSCQQNDGNNKASWLENQDSWKERIKCTALVVCNWIKVYSLCWLGADPPVLCREKLWDYQNWNKEKWVSSHKCPSKVSEEDGEKPGPSESLNATTSRGTTSIPCTHNQCEPLKYLVLETAYRLQWSPG